MFRIRPGWNESDLASSGHTTLRSMVPRRIGSTSEEVSHRGFPVPPPAAFPGERDCICPRARIAREREELRVVNDPDPEPHAGRGDSTAGCPHQPVRWRCCYPAETVRYVPLSSGRPDLMAWIRQSTGLYPSRPPATMPAIDTDSHTGFSAPRRPQFSVGDNPRMAEVFGIRLPDWGQQLALALNGVSADEFARTTKTAALGSTATY